MSVFIAIALILLIYAVIYGLVLLWNRAFHAADLRNSMDDARTPEGSFRFFYHILWVLLFFSLAVFLFPMILSYRSELQHHHGLERVEVLMKLGFLPILMLLLLSYGRRRGYMHWLEDLNWPRRDQ